MSLRSFLSAVNRYLNRGAVLLDGFGGTVDMNNAEQFFRDRRDSYVPAGRRHLEAMQEAELPAQ